MWTIFKVFIEFATALLLFSFFKCFSFLGPKACGILAPQPGIEPSAPCIGRQGLNYWTPREAPVSYFTDGDVEFG